MENPLKQFAIKPLIPIHVGGYDISFTNSSLLMTIAFVLIVLLFSVGTSRKALVPGRLQSATEMMYEFVANMVEDNAGHGSEKYIPLVMTIFLVVLFGSQLQRTPHLGHVVGLIDAAGLGAYAVVGMNLALAVGLPLIGVAVVGMVNAVGGGILRDVLNREEPNMFKPGTLEESSALIGCIVFIALIKLTPVGQFIAAWVTIALVFAIRLIAIRYHIQTKALAAFQDTTKAQ